MPGKKVSNFGCEKHIHHILAVPHSHLFHPDNRRQLDRVGGGGKARLTDFGLAKIISNGTQTSNRTLGGTFGYVQSPASVVDGSRVQRTVHQNAVT